MHAIQAKKKSSNVLTIPAPKYRMPCASKFLATRHNDKRRSSRTSTKNSFRREDW